MQALWPPAAPPEPAAHAPALADELVQSGLRRTHVVARTLIAIELALLALETLRSGFDWGDTVTWWRLAALAFLALHLLVARAGLSAAWSLRYFLAGGMALCVWISALMNGRGGDLSAYAIGALGVAAACPLPGRFNPALFVASGLALGGWLLHSQAAPSLYALSNLVAACVMGVVVERFSFRAACQAYTQRAGIQIARERADALLTNVFPHEVALALKRGERSIAQHAEVGVLFADVVGFTRLSSRLLPSHLLEVLEEVFGRFDDLAQQHGVTKLKTVGDAYLAVANAPQPCEHPLERLAGFALDAVAACQAVAQRHRLPLQLRVGLHCGPVVAGVIGRTRLNYDLWGDTVNTAQRITAQAQPDQVLVSEPVFYRLRESMLLSPCGVPELKGLGPTPVFALNAASPPAPASSSSATPYPTQPAVSKRPDLL